MSDTKPPKPETFMFADDGSVPNNARLPFVVYRHVIDMIGVADPEPVIEKLFRENGWGDTWRNGIFPYVHYHSRIHEGMGIARFGMTIRWGWTAAGASGGTVGGAAACAGLISSTRAAGGGHDQSPPPAWSTTARSAWSFSSRYSSVITRCCSAS